MYEELKEEIRSVVKPNLKGQINGQNLQEVLIDMVDNYPTSSTEVEDLVEKSGSWDEASDWVTNNSSSVLTSESLEPLEQEIQEIQDTYATTASLNSVSESISQSIADIPQPDLSIYATTASVTDLSRSVAESIEHIDVDLSEYATTASVLEISESISQSIAAITGSDISSYATTASVNAISESISSSILTLSESVSQSISEIPQPDLSIYATTASVLEISESISQSIAAITGSDLSIYATTASLNSVSESISSSLLGLSESVSQSIADIPQPDLSIYATTASLNNYSQSMGTVSASFDQRINSIPTGSNLWVAGEGEGAIKQQANSTASGDYSLVVGDVGNKALGINSMAQGDGTTAEGEGSHAEGFQTLATGENAHAEGFNTLAGDNYSHAEGMTTTASGEAAHAEGRQTIASGQFSHAEGNRTTGSGQYSHAEGQQTEALGESSHVEGFGAKASGYASHAEGSDTIASEIYSHAEGYQTTASGQASHAEGDNSQTLGWASHAEGQLTVASGQFSHAEGTASVATQDYSHAEGQETTASGFCSHAEGFHTTTTNPFEHAQGQYNATGTSQIFSVGCGTGENDRRNAVSIINSPLSGSVFVHGVGGYDGTNPIPGTNDLATTINAIPGADLSGYATTASVNAISSSLSSSIADVTDTYWTSSGHTLPGLTRKISRTPELAAKAVNLGVWVSHYNVIGFSYGTSQPSEADPKYHYSRKSGLEIGDYVCPLNSDNNTEVLGKVLSSGSDDQGVYVILDRFIGYPAYGSKVEICKVNGEGSVAEGLVPVTTNPYEHAAGRYNATTSSQILSVGCGESGSRRNALAILTGSNSGTVYVYGVGGYNGTNPTPGTNDLAAIIGGMTRETWTFTLTDSSSVTKSILVG